MKKKLVSLLSLTLIVILSFTNVYALEITKAGDTVVQEGDYDSIRLVAGNTVTNKANVDGLSLVAGNEVTVEGSAPYGLYAGNSVTVSEKVEKDMFVAGNNIVIDSDAIIGRDAYIAGNTVKIKANITRDLRLGSSSVDLSGVTIGGDAYITADRIILDENTVITGKLTYVEDANVTGIEKATIGSIKTTKSNEVVIEYSFKTRLYDFVVSYLGAIVTMLVLFYILPKIKEKLDKLELSFNSIAKTSLSGLIALIIIPILTLILVFTGILTPVSLIAICLYVVSIYLSTLFVGYIVGNLLTTKLLKKDSKYLALACGILLLKLIKLIPVIGGIITAISLFYGLGIIFNLIRNKNK